jgi:hypothetical protein
MGDRVFLLIGLATLLTHEMDAIRAHEWRIFPLTAGLGDPAGYRVFVLAHVPLYVGLFGLLARPQGLGGAVAVGLDSFLIAHAGLHAIYLRHPKNEFTGWLSWLLILGAATAGALDLLFGS